jgi:Family of unknown function (DUF6283)
MTGLAPRTRPCSSCPYRADAPSGLWAVDEYALLPGYDGTTGQQAEAGAFGVFCCHQQPGRLCAGWAGCHDMAECLAIRIHHREVDMPATLAYTSPIPLHPSGAAAAAHGLRDIDQPDARTRAKVAQLLRLAHIRINGEDQES